MKAKRIVFLTGTRADYGKLKSLMLQVEESPLFELQIFATGMHMLSKYGSTYSEIEKDGFKNIYRFVNTRVNQHMDITLSNTIVGFSNFVMEYKPDLIVVHGDRIEALAGAMVGALNNIKVAHVEGGEISGTIDESIRHAVTKFSHFHFVANEDAKKHVIQLGENAKNIYVIGSPDIDIMFSDTLPTLEEVKERYEIPYEEYAIFMYHPVTTELKKLSANIKQVVEGLVASERNYVVIFPNNDEGSEIILHALLPLRKNDRFKIFPSIRFEAFLVLLEYANFMIGNSSAGIREAEVYAIPSIDLGTRQKGRYILENERSIIHAEEQKDEIIKSICLAENLVLNKGNKYGNGHSALSFIEILESNEIWKKDIQKKFIPFTSQF